MCLGVAAYDRNIPWPGEIEVNDRSGPRKGQDRPSTAVSRFDRPRQLIYVLGIFHVLQNSISIGKVSEISKESKQLVFYGPTSAGV